MASPRAVARMPTSPATVVMIYALESAVWAALTAGWLSLRLILTPSLADQTVRVSAIALAVFHLLLSSALYDSPKPDIAYFAALFPQWVLYVCMLLEAGTAPVRVDNALFGGLFLYFSAAAISLAFLTVQVLLSAAAVAHRGQIWRASALWVDHTLLLLSSLHACLSQESHLEFASALLVMQVIFIVTLGLRLWRFEDPKFPVSGGTFPLALALEITHGAAAGVLGILTIAAAFVARTTAWVLPVVVVPLVIYAALRAAFWERPPPNAKSTSDFAPTTPSEQELPPLAPPQATSASASLVHAHAADQPHPPYGRLLAPPFPGQQPRPAVKKQL